MVVRVLYAFGRPPALGLGPRLRHAGTWARIFLADGLRLRESLLVGLGFINHVSTLMLGLTQHQTENMCHKECLITTKPNFAIIIDRDVVMHDKIGRYRVRIVMAELTSRSAAASEFRFGEAARLKAAGRWAVLDRGGR